MARKIGRRKNGYPIDVTSAEAQTLQADAAGAPRNILLRIRTFDSFRHRDFSLFFAGALVSNVGSWMQMTALGWLVFELTKRSSTLGMVNFLGGAPVFFMAVFTGIAADHLDRRMILIATQVVLAVQAGLFGWLAGTAHVTMAWVYGLSLMGGVASAFMSPAFQAMTPDLVPRESLMNAIALNSAQFNAARLLGPMAAAGVIFAFGGSQTGGIAEIFWVNAVSFLFVIWALAIIRPRQHAPKKDAGTSPTHALLAGVRYAVHHRRVWTHLLSAAMLTIFGMPFATLLPAITRTALHMGARGYTALLASNGLGALVGALGVASLPSTIRRETLVRYALVVMSLGAIALSFSRSVFLSAAVLVVMGAAFLTSVSSINTNIQTSVPPHLRGRVMSLFVMAFMGMMPFGALAFGALGDVVGPTQAVLIGAVVLLAWAGALLVRPQLLSEEAPAESR